MPKQITSPIAAYRKAHDRMSQEAFGALFKPAVDKSTVHRWENGSVRITAERAISIEAVTGIPRHVLRPDVFAAPERELASKSSGKQGSSAAMVNERSAA